MRSHMARKPVSLQPSISQPSLTITPRLDLIKVTSSWHFVEETWGDAGVNTARKRAPSGPFGELKKILGHLFLPGLSHPLKSLT